MWRVSSSFFVLFFQVSCFLLCFSQCLFFFFLSFLLSVRVSRFFSESVLVQSSKLLPVLLWGRFAGCLSVSKFRQLLCCSVTVFLETEHLCPLSASLYTLYVRVSLSVIAGMMTTISIVTSGVTEFFPRFDSIRLTALFFFQMLNIFLRYKICAPYPQCP